MFELHCPNENDAARISWIPSRDPEETGAEDSRRSGVIQHDTGSSLYTYKVFPTLWLIRRSFRALFPSDRASYEAFAEAAAGNDVRLFDPGFNAWLDVKLWGAGIDPVWRKDQFGFIVDLEFRQGFVT